MTFDCLLLETADGPVRTVAMRIDLFVDVAPTADALGALNQIAVAHTQLAAAWKKTLLVDGRCPRACAGAQARAGARAALAIEGGVGPEAIASHLKQHWAPAALPSQTFTTRRVVVCMDGWNTGSCGELADAAASTCDGAQLADANPSETQRSSRRRFGRKRYVKPEQ